MGVDSDSDIIHAVKGTTTTVHDSQKLEHFLHGQENDVQGDNATCSQKEAETLPQEGALLNTTINQS